jgi:hypothetical protein
MHFHSAGRLLGACASFLHVRRRLVSGFGNQRSACFLFSELAQGGSQAGEGKVFDYIVFT